MVFASSIPLLVRRCVLPITCLGLASISCFGQSVFFTVSATPYDRQMVRVYPILSSTNAQLPNPISPSSAVSQWMCELRAIPYQYSKHWQTPSEINLAQATDCKGKAVALYAEMRKNGAKNLRVVIGRHHIYDSATHAWLEWETMGGSYVLDPTFNATPAKKVELSPMTYVPLYAYDAEHKYRSVNAGSVVSTAKVTAGYANHPYAPASAGSTSANPQRVKSGQSIAARTKSARPSTQDRQSNLRYSGSNVGRSSSNVAGPRRTGAIAAKPIAKNVTAMQAKPASVATATRTGRPLLVQKRPAPNVRVSPSNVAGRNQPRTIAAKPVAKNVTAVQSKPAAAATATRTGRPLLVQKRPVSNVRTSQSNVVKATQPPVLTGTPKAKIVTQVQPKSATVATPARTGRALSIQKRSVSNAQSSTPNAVGVRQTQSLSQNGKPVTRMEPRLPAAASQL
jgi:hypothetical protein